MASVGPVTPEAFPSVLSTEPMGQRFPKWCLTLVHFLMGIMTALNSIGFGIIVFGSIKFKMELTPSQIITLSLGLGQIALDVIMLVCLPYVLDVCRLETHVEILCRLAFLIGFGSNVFLHTIIHSLDLCFKIRNPFTYLRKMTEKRALILVIFSWVICPCTGLAMVQFIHFNDDLTKIKCPVVGIELKYKIPFLFFMNSIIVILLLLVVVPTLLVVRTARKHARKIKHQEEILHGVYERNVACHDDDARRMNRMIAKKNCPARPTSGKAITDFLFFVSCFITAWIAILLGIDIVVLSDEDIIHKINVLTGLIILLYNQCAIGILIYTLRQPHCRKIRQLLKKSVSKYSMRLRCYFKD